MRILVINPNSNTNFSDQMDRAVAPLRFGGAVQIDCLSLRGTPLGIETQRDIDAVIDPVCDMVSAKAEAYDGFVIACFADTGVMSAREVTSKPVLGICEAGLATALNAGERFGVISTSQEARNAELRLIRSHGLIERCAGMEPVDIPVVEMMGANDLPARMDRAAAKLIEQGAEALVLGCAGMAPHRARLQQATGLPVIDPTVAGVGVALTLIAATGPKV
jgi:Asp/Glu/hydantoin racemase